LWLCRKSPWRYAPSPFAKWEICSLRSQVPQFFFVVMPKIPQALRAVPLYKVGNLFAALTGATIFLCGYAENPPGATRRLPLQSGKFVRYAHKCHNFSLWLCRKSSWRCAPSPFTKWEICSLRSQVPQFFFVVMPKNPPGAGAPSPFTKWEICSLRSQVPQFLETEDLFITFTYAIISF